ncbi:MAG: GNAT family N-acetyltransferase [Eubacteriales bacterium]|nr:GNAT family N-acetyltransferase [Eubacteriales bacterium]
MPADYTIQTPRLTLKPLGPAYLATTHAYASDAQNTVYMFYLPNDTVQETAQFLCAAAAEWQKDTPSFYEFAVLLADRHIGAVSVSLSQDRRQGELGWIIDRQHQQKGYATEAAQAVMAFAIDELHVQKIVAHCDARNQPSQRLMRKLGLTLERDDGIRRNRGSDEDVQELMYARSVDAAQP